MTDRFVGKAEEFAEGRRKMVTVDHHEVIVFEHAGQFYAFENLCLHQGGPVGEGALLGKVEVVLDEFKCFVREEFSETEIHLVCPWHGWEYDIQTGAFAGDRSKRLRKYEVYEREGKVHLRV